jgi:hypothetical protein
VVAIGFEPIFLYAILLHKHKEKLGGKSQTDYWHHMYCCCYMDAFSGEPTESPSPAIVVLIIGLSVIATSRLKKT